MAKRRASALTNKAYNDGEENGILDKLFETPDLTFGSFSVLFDPKFNDLKVKFQVENLDSCHLCLYSLVSKMQVV